MVHAINLCSTFGTENGLAEVELRRPAMQTWMRSSRRSCAHVPLERLPRRNAVLKWKAGCGTWDMGKGEVEVRCEPVREGRLDDG